MGRPKKRTTDGRITAREPEDKTASEGEGSADAREAEILALLGAAPDTVEFLIKVFQIEAKASGGNAVEWWLFNVPQDDLSDLDQVLRDTYGAGTYRIRIRRRDRAGDNRWAQIYQSDFSVKRAPGAPPLIPPLPTPAAAPAATNDTALLLQAIKTQGEQFIAALKELQRVDRPTPIGELIEGVKSLQALSAPAAPAGSPVESMKAMLEFMREFGSEQREQGWMDIAAKAIESPLLQDLFTRKPGGAATAALPAPASSSPETSTRPAAAAVPAGLSGVQAQFAGAIIGQLVEFAKSGTMSSEMAADWCHEQVPPTLIKTVAMNDIFFKQIQDMAPGVSAHLPWFNALRATLREDILEAEREARGEDDAPEESPPADAASEPTKPGVDAA